MPGRTAVVRAFKIACLKPHRLIDIINISAEIEGGWVDLGTVRAPRPYVEHSESPLRFNGGQTLHGHEREKYE